MTSNGAATASRLTALLKLSYPLQIPVLLRNHRGLGLLRPISVIPDNNFLVNLADSISACYITHPDFDRDYIVYNSAHSAERNRFSVVHELGHAALGHRPWRLADLVESGKLPERPVNEEQEADEFACELLMPLELVKKAADDNSFLDPITLAFLLRDRKYFRVSLETMCRRLVTTGILNGMYLLLGEEKGLFLYRTEGYEPPPMTVVVETAKRMLNPRPACTFYISDAEVTARRFNNGQILIAAVYRYGDHEVPAVF